MTTTYNPSLSDSISKVRQFLGDTNVTDADLPAEVQDETINAYLATKSILSTAAQLARDLAAKYAGMVDISVDHQTTKASQKYLQYTELAEKLEVQAARETALSDAGTSAVMVTGIGDCRGPYDLCPGAPIYYPGYAFGGTW